MPVTYRDGRRVEDGPAGSTPPPMRPSGIGESAPQARNGNGGGKGGGMAESQDQITKSMNDKKWGYYDPYTAKKVPWYIDMINGGGKNAAGEDFSGGVGTIGLGGALANILGINPYGQDRERTYGGGDFYMGGDVDPSLLYQFGRPAGGGGAGNTSRMLSAPPPRPNQITTPPLRGPAGSTSTINVPPLSGPAGAPVPQTGLLNQYQEQYENIPMASQTIRMPEVAPTNVTTFDDFMKMQKEMEQQYGLSSMTPDEYMSVYQRFLKRTQASSY